MNDKDWTDSQVDKASESFKAVTETVKNRLKEMLRGPLQERQLPIGELNKLATVLIADMAPEKAKAESDEIP